MLFRKLSQVQLFVTPWTQHDRLLCPSLSPWICSDSCPLSQWCHPIISFSVTPFSCPQPFPASGSFPLSQFFMSGIQNIGASTSASVLPKNIQDWFPLGLTGLISLKFKGLSRVFSNTIVQRHQFFSVQLSLWYNSHIHTWLEKTIALTRWTFVGKVISLFFNMLFRFVIAFLPRSKHLSISWKHSPSAVILQIQKYIKKKKKCLSLFPHLFAMKWWDRMPLS